MCCAAACCAALRHLNCLPVPQVLELSLLITIGFFSVDTVAMWAACWLHDGKDRPVIFTWHHFACCLYAASCLYLGIGAETAAVATVVGEVTNPMQNIWFISKDVGRMDVYGALSPVFTYFFIIVRCILTPLWSADVIVSTHTRARTHALPPCMPIWIGQPALPPPPLLQRGRSTPSHSRSC